MLRQLRAVAFVLSVAGVLLGTSLTAAAQDVDKMVEQACQVLKAGGFGAAKPMLDSPGLAEAAAAAPDKLRKLCAAADEGRAEVEKKDAADAKEAVAGLVALAAHALEANPESADAMWSVALTRLARGRLERDFEGKPDIADWKESAALLEKAWGKMADEGRPAGAAVEALREASRLPGAPSAELSQAADALLERAIQKHPDGGRLIAVWGARQLERAQAVPPAKKAEANAIVDAALKRLQPAASRKDPDIDAATAWNELVKFALDNKLSVKAAFVTRSVKFGSDLEMRVPVSRYFVVNEESAAPYVHQLTRDFKKLRTIGFQRYSWSTSYDFDVKGYSGVGGDNLKGIATADFFQNKSELATEKSSKAPAKRRLNGRIADALYWELSGVRPKETDEERYRFWFFKSDKGNATTYAVHVFEWTPDDIDAAALSVLDSITELGK